jgi:hypothetical protein
LSNFMALISEPRSKPHAPARAGDSNCHYKWQKTEG